MRNFIEIGPVSIKVGNRHLAKWGYPFVRIGGLSLFTRHSDGALGLAGYHPRWSTTWIWSLSLSRRMPPTPVLHFARGQRGQWHHWLRLPFGWTLYLARQDYHRERSA